MGCGGGDWRVGEVGVGVGGMAGGWAGGIAFHTNLLPTYLLLPPTHEMRPAVAPPERLREGFQRAILVAAATKAAVRAVACVSEHSCATSKWSSGNPAASTLQ